MKSEWRDPTEAEVESARSRYPELPDGRLWRLARAEARMVDLGVPQPKHRGEMTREVVKGYRTADGEVGKGGGDFEVHTQARGDLFAHLGTPASIKVWGKAS